MAVAPPSGLPSERLSGLPGKEEAEEGEWREGTGLLEREWKGEEGRRMEAHEVAAGGTRERELWLGSVTDGY